MNLMNPSKHWAGYKPTKDVENFRNNGGSSGLDGGSKVGMDSLSESDVIFYYHLLKSVVGEEFLDQVWFNEKGNPNGPIEDGRVITRSDIQNTYNAWRLAPYLKDGMKIVEIGPGFGGLAAMLCRLADVHIDLVDLPDQREIQRYYLDGFNVDWKEPDELTKADMVINIRSMMEMNYPQVNGYFRIIYDVIKPDWFYCCNRYLKRTTLTNYPFYDNWEPIISRPLFLEPTVHEFLLRPGKGIRRELQSLSAHYVTFKGKSVIATIPLEMQRFELFSEAEVNNTQL